ncbi:MAG TPA: hypothetical protein VEK08_12770 [Planctomycetota bacterium]|nr:hypothetical protein [Planctomycetota bacterium]
MGDVTRSKASTLIQNLDRRYGKVERPSIVPPPTSADAAAIAAVSAKNAQIIAGVILGLHGAPSEGADAARKLMQHFVDWNEVRVSRPATLVAVMGRQPRAQTRIALLQRFLEAFFLRQRNLSLDYLYTLKNHEARRFLSDLEVFDREELAAVYLTGFSVPVFPPSDVLRDIAEATGLIKPKTTTLQMAKKFETALDAETLYTLYSHMYSLANDPEKDSILKKKKK